MSAKFDVFELTKHFEDSEKRFTFLLNFLDNTYTFTKDEYKKKVTKTLVSQIIELYSDENSPFRSDPRLLRAWELLGITSTSLGYDGVMQKLDDLGYFKMCPEFYELRNASQRSASSRNVSERTTSSHSLQGSTGSERSSKIHIASAEAATKTPTILATTQPPAKSSLAPTPPAKSPLAPTPPAKSPVAPTPPAKSPVAPTPSAKSPVASIPLARSSLKPTYAAESPLPSIPPATSPIPLSTATPKESSFVRDSPQSKVPVANYSFTTHLHRDAVCAFGETLPLSQEAIPAAPASFHRALKNNEKDFSVFAEEDEEEAMDTNPTPVPPPLHSHHILSHPSIRDSPVMKKARGRRDSDDEIESSFDNPFGDIGGFRKKFAAPKTLFDSDKIVVDDPTISGFNKQQSTSRASSTPTGGKSAVPTFEVSPTATFPQANKENAPFTFAPAIATDDVVKSPQPSKRSILPPLSEAISRMSIAPVDDLDATTHDINVMPEVEIKSGINPWSESERLKVLEKAPPMVEQHEFLATKAPSFNVKSVELGGEKFKIIKFIAQGGFARIYKTQAEDGKKYAIKLEMPSCPWEVYICKSLSVRLPFQIQPFVMSIRDAYIFSNASAIVYDFYPLKTLLDLANAYKTDNNSTMDGMLAAFVGIQIAEILNYVHRAQIVHADVKPDNFVIVEPMQLDLPHYQYVKPFVKLIDWGRAIDMSFYPDQTFKGRAGTNGFDCHEMQEDRPWTYQTDFFGYVGTMHVLMFNNYMKTFYHPTKLVYCFTEQLKRRYPLCETWTNIFREFLNIPNCDKMPSWDNVVVQLKQDLEDFATEDVSAWRRAVDKCNAVLRKYVN